jgi:hypothetical protein
VRPERLSRESDTVVGERGVAREDAEVILKRVGDEDAITWIGVVARQLGCRLEQPGGDLEHAELGAEHRAQVARRSQPSRLALDRRLPDRHRAQATIDRRVEQQRSLPGGQPRWIAESPQSDVGVDENGTHCV